MARSNFNLNDGTVGHFVAGTGSGASADDPFVQAIADPGGPGTDGSLNPPDVSALTLIKTVAVNPLRTGFILQVQDTTDLTVLLDDGTGATPATAIILTTGGRLGALSLQSGVLCWHDIPHTGRFRFYAASSAYQLAFREYPG